MGRPRSTIPGEQRGVWLPLPVWVKIDLMLYSEIEGKIPHGRQAEFFLAAAEAEIARRQELMRIGGEIEALHKSLKEVS